MLDESPDYVVLYGSDAEIKTLVTQSPRLHLDNNGVVLLSDRFIAKFYTPDCLTDKMKTIEIAQSLGIRIPKIIRAIQHPDVTFLVMERVEGQTLEDAWAGLSWYSSLRLAFQLRRFVSLMRSITSDTAGSIVTGECRSFWLDDRFGLPARATVGYVMEFLAFWTGFRSIKHEYKKSSRDHAVLKRSSDLQVKSFVLTHHDLAPRNIMVDKLGDAWLIDWDLAGYYPIYFEYASMSNFRIPESWGYFGRLRWWIVTWLAAGRYEKQSKQLWAIRTKLQRFPVGRRLNIKANVTQPRLEQALASSESSDSSLHSMMGSHSDTDGYDVIIIGAGVSGINAAYRLQTELPGCRLVILEARASIGGTWDLFRYPGIRSDSDIFSFGFAWRPWYRSELLAHGRDIKQYMVDAARDTGIDKHIRYHHKVLSANWVSKERAWELLVQEPGRTEAAVYRGQFVFLGTGYYNYEQPRQTTIPGLETFQGNIIHPQFWPKDYDYTDKEMVVIGSGATAVTIVPSVAEKVKRVTMLQRSPTYMFPLASRSRVRSFLFAVLPGALMHRINRVTWILFAYLLTVWCAHYPAAVARYIRKRTVAALPAGYAWDPHFKPRYKPWEQRLCVVPDGDIFAAIRSSKAVVVTDTIETVTADAIRLSSGQRLPADVIVTATGIQLLFAGGIRFTLDGGAPLDAARKVVWNAAMIQDLPNTVFAIGYLKSGAWTLGADCAARLLIRLMREARTRGARMVTPRLDEDGGREMARRPLWGILTSTYLEGYEKAFPQTGTGIWCNRENYIKDMYAARWGDIQTGLCFEE
ncbi:flavin-binding monooxygenase, putative [Cordyceps militaris CM01]|uniref:Flavin-binding monooxygenase, putative n=1 Tax=Cordyceps militaris (strain CM01) TaxID=983644 RepID=G3J8D4_CORMM|nr:flavin-binding monooxygenase, putative [Cordyceps militaris CM01]EGX93923.1 flavin-binding monooxygenase, putative [Cordyceps militaris CM01]